MICATALKKVCSCNLLPYMCYFSKVFDNDTIIRKLHIVTLSYCHLLTAFTTFKFQWCNPLQVNFSNALQNNQSLIMLKKDIKRITEILPRPRLAPMPSLVSCHSQQNLTMAVPTAMLPRTEFFCGVGKL